ncbi:MAG: hypothetical protein RR977_00265 [Oscillospiraceae bacterium]
MVLDLVDKEGTKSGKGLSWSWFGLNDGKRDAKILRELGELYKGSAIDVDVFDKKIKGLTVSSRANAKEMKANSANNIEFSKGLLNAAASADKMTISTKLAALGMNILKTAMNMAVTAAVSWVIFEGIPKLIDAVTVSYEEQIETLATLKEEVKKFHSHFCETGKLIF